MADNPLVAAENDIEAEVRRRYADGAHAQEPCLCSPVDYDARYLALLPEEIVRKDYGCGDPSKYVEAGDTVLDLGSGAGKICYILSQKVGPTGRVIGVDFNDAMLELARKYLDEMAAKIGHANVRFVKGRIQDLALDLEAAEQRLTEQPIATVEHLSAFEAHCEALRRKQPMIADGSVDVVVSNCVLNLVKPQDKQQLFRELHRVLKRGGRAVISDIVCDEDPTDRILSDPKLWSGCIAGAFREDRFLEMFQEAGFYGIEILARDDQPWQVIDGIEFRSVTVRAFKGKEGPCLERHHAVVYGGPWKTVTDDDGHTLIRGKRMAVCDKTYRIFTAPNGPYHDQIIGIQPYNEILPDDAEPFDCRRSAIRDPRQTKGENYDVTELSDSSLSCNDSGQCC